MARKKRNQFDVDEIYRNLRTNIEFSQMDDEIQVISVASTISSEGKSSVACNLARIMAAKYNDVLLIDCDLRHPSVHKMMKVSNRSGLTNIIAQFQDGLSVNSYEGVQQVIFEGGQNLTLIIEYQILVKYWVQKEWVVFWNMLEKNLVISLLIHHQ